MFKDLIIHFNELFTIYVVFPSIVLLGIYLTFKLKFVQISKLKMGFEHLFKKSDASEKGDISHYQAISTVLAGNFGTGNISGMAIALSMGGVGALFWMWVMAFFGSALQFASCFLGVKYREKNEDGQYVGGPMYYLSKGLKSKPIAMIFAGCVVFAAFTAGAFTQVHAMSLPLETLGVPPLLIGCIIAFFVAIVILGGANFIAKISSGVVPFMAILYLGTAVVILGIHYAQILPAFVVMFKAAFGGGSLVGGVLGFTTMKALTTGFGRAIFATDAGTGTVPILQAGAKTKHPVIDGVVSLTAPFLVMIVCTATALVLIVTGAFGESNLQSTNMVTHAFQQEVGSSAGLFIVLSSLVLFGYTTILAWASCLERAVGFIWGKRFVRPFHILYIVIVPVGAFMHGEFVWILADLALSSMMVLNLIGVAGLSREVVRDSEAFFGEQKEALQSA